MLKLLVLVSIFFQLISMEHLDSTSSFTDEHLKALAHELLSATGQEIGIQIYERLREHFDALNAIEQTISTKALNDEDAYKKIITFFTHPAFTKHVDAIVNELFIHSILCEHVFHDKKRLDAIKNTLLSKLTPAMRTLIGFRYEPHSRILALQASNIRDPVQFFSQKLCLNIFETYWKDSDYCKALNSIENELYAHYDNEEELYRAISDLLRYIPFSKFAKKALSTLSKFELELQRFASTISLLRKLVIQTQTETDMFRTAFNYHDYCREVGALKQFIVQLKPLMRSYIKTAYDKELASSPNPTSRFVRISDTHSLGIAGAIEFDELQEVAAICSLYGNAFEALSIVEKNILAQYDTSKKKEKNILVQYSTEEAKERRLLAYMQLRQFSNHIDTILKKISFIIFHYSANLTELESVLNKTIFSKLSPFMSSFIKHRYLARHETSFCFITTEHPEAKTFLRAHSQPLMKIHHARLEKNMLKAIFFLANYRRAFFTHTFNEQTFREPNPKFSLGFLSDHAYNLSHNENLFAYTAVHSYAYVGSNIIDLVAYGYEHTIKICRIFVINLSTGASSTIKSSQHKSSKSTIDRKLDSLKPCFSHNNKLLFAGWGLGCFLWDIMNSRIIGKEFTGDQFTIKRAKFSRYDDLLVILAYGHDISDSYIIFMETNRGNILYQIPFAGTAVVMCRTLKCSYDEMSFALLPPLLGHWPITLLSKQDNFNAFLLRKVIEQNAIQKKYTRLSPQPIFKSVAPMGAHAMLRELGKKWAEALTIKQEKKCEGIEQQNVSTKVTNVNEDSQKHVYLCIDGEGMHAFLSACMLDAIEEQTRSKIAHLVDVVTGSAFGAIVGLGVIASKDGKDALLSSEMVSEWLSLNGRTLFNTKHASKVEPRYSNETLKQALGSLFARTTSSNALTEFIIPLVRTDARKNTLEYFSYSRDAAQRNQKNDFLLEQVASFAASDRSFFGPARDSKDAHAHRISASSRYFNNSAEVVYDIVRENNSAKEQALVLWLTPGVMNEENLRTHDRLRQLLGANYARITPSEDCLLEAADNAALEIVERYQTAAEKACTGWESFFRKLQIQKDDTR